MAEVSKQQEVLRCLYLCVKPPNLFDVDFYYHSAAYTAFSLPPSHSCHVLTLLQKQSDTSKLSASGRKKKDSLEKTRQLLSPFKHCAFVQRAQDILFAVRHMLFLTTLELFLICSSTKFSILPPLRDYKGSTVHEGKKYCAKRCSYDDTFHAICLIQLS